VPGAARDSSIAEALRSSRHSSPRRACSLRRREAARRRLHRLHARGRSRAAARTRGIHLTRTPLGTSPCPLKDCNEAKIPVYAYNSTGDPRRSRFAGRVFGVCPACGRVEQSTWLQKNLTRAEPSHASEHASRAADAPVTPPSVSRASPPRATRPVSSARAPRAAGARARASAGAAAARTTPVSEQTSRSPAGGSSWLPDFWGKNK
jgi:hypothetical protein